MCPACLTAISMIVAGVVSTGGAAALTAKVLQARKVAKDASDRSELQAPQGHIEEKEND